jgi:oxygen-independent coproporphyrinogen-3 oxidase
MSEMKRALTFDAELLRRHDRPGPRYTSYPSAPQFRTDFGAEQVRAEAVRTNEAATRRALSLYLHVPFCFSPCFYCGCNRLITRDRSKGERYARSLQREIGLVAPVFDDRREVIQLHLGGGTPNFLSVRVLEQLMEKLHGAFRLSATAERDFSIELDPRSVPEEYPATLARLGFNRVSLGVQDFDPAVQDAVNRIQSIEQTLDLIDACRDGGVESVNLDLIYGLPYQTLEGFRSTLRTVVSARPDRVAVYGYAHLPHVFKAQQHIDSAALPGPELRLQLLALAIEELSLSGYRYIGMDHFALPEDELVRSQEARTLQRNFMGYTTHADCDLIGLGVSAISHIGESFSQNFRDLRTWEESVAAGRLPIWRGLALNTDDRVRGALIGKLMCHDFVDIGAIETHYGIKFGTYFSEALEQLKPHVKDGLLTLDAEGIAVTARGRLLVRSIAMCFDRYLDPQGAAADVPRYSKVV